MLQESSIDISIRFCYTIIDNTFNVLIISKEATNMAKNKTKVTPQADVMPQDDAMQQLIENAINEIKEEVPVVNEQPADAEQPATDVKVDISTIIAVIPDTFTPATLDKLFKFNDGGKTVRRHLRKYFATAMAHEHKTNWSFNKTTNADVIEYFAAKYAFDLEAIAATTK